MQKIEYFNVTESLSKGSMDVMVMLTLLASGYDS